MKKNIICFFIGGLIFGTIGATAATLLTAADVSYTREGTEVTSAKEAIDDLNDRSVAGKSSIISKLNDKGLSLGMSSTYQNILDGIESLPIGKTEDGEWGYIKEGEGLISPFGGNIKYSISRTNYYLVSNNTYGRYFFSEFKPNDEIKNYLKTFYIQVTNGSPSSTVIDNDYINIYNYNAHKFTITFKKKAYKVYNESVTEFIAGQSEEITGWNSTGYGIVSYIFP